MAEETKESRLLLRGIMVLRVIGAAPEPLSFAAIHRQTHLPKATVFRILAALQHSGFVMPDASGRAYRLGPALLDLLDGVATERVRRNSVRAELETIADELERPVWSWRIEGSLIRPSEQTLPFGMATQEGQRSPMRLDQSAAGIAVLAAMDAARSTAFIGALRIGDAAARGTLSLMLGFAAATGFAIRSTTLDGGQATATELAAAFASADGQPEGAISVEVFEGELSDSERHQVGRRLAFAARRISQGPRRGPRPNAVSRRHVPPPVACCVKCAVGPEHRDQVGSSPYWDSGRGRVVWIDSLGGAVGWFSPASGSIMRHELNDLPGAIAPFGGGRAVVASRGGIALLDLDSGLKSVLSHPEPDDAMRRFSVARVGPDGRLWVCSLRPIPVPGLGQGRIYALSPAGQITQVLNLERGAKGMCWSRDGRHLYLTQAGSKTILRYEMDESGTRPTLPRSFAVHEGDGTPNGLAMDMDGCLWAAIYGGWQVKRFDPNGREIGKIELPAPLPTALCFGGHRRQDLYITTCRLHVPPDILAGAPGSGGLLHVPVDAKGMPDAEFRLASD